MRVGGARDGRSNAPRAVRWCASYLVFRPNHTHFRSRHTLGPSYRTSYLKPNKTSSGTCKRDLWIGLARGSGGEPPIRPKNMHRRTFERLVDKLIERLRDASAILGPTRALRGLPRGDVLWEEAWDLGLGDLFALRMMLSGMARLNNIDLRRRNREAARRRATTMHESAGCARSRGAPRLRDLL